MFSGEDAAYQALIDGEIDAVVDYSPSAFNHVNSNKNELKMVGEPFAKIISYAIAVCNRDKELFFSLNSSLSEIKSDGTYDELVQAWFSTENK
jgi:ABC-type amino acid transport substrate-binding protein